MCPSSGPNPRGLCECGCGKKTRLAAKTESRHGWVKGQPKRFIAGHNQHAHSVIIPPNPSGLCQCGCGESAPIADATSSRKGWLKGHPMRFIRGHHYYEHPRSAVPYIVDPVTGCWEWQWGKNGDGYAVMYVDGQPVHASRWYYEQKYGPIPEGLFACHTCDNPGCVNPDDIFPGTQQDNIQDAVAKGRYRNHNAEKTHCTHGHMLAGENLYQYKGHRFCRECDRLRGAAYRARKRAHEVAA